MVFPENLLERYKLQFFSLLNSVLFMDMVYKKSYLLWFTCIISSPTCKEFTVMNYHNITRKGIQVNVFTIILAGTS